ncbi:hypothetical protein [Methanolobus chelungpuianus]|uniref:Uncharacterized protein n=1 Tax=Methanolobus chelungpuianus TaxID=502115 RepID=A0AAE3HAB3_9EURY|nr:hypothetical protein [Methanolobus chelungpuianus]MCQ6962895.1 hypothetical protein [Methanolobus chelungpuianus]
MTFEAIEKRLSLLERQRQKGRAIFFSTQFDRYEDYLVEAKKARNECPSISSISIVPSADELRKCLERMVTADTDEDLIESVREQFSLREQQEKDYQERLKCCQEAWDDGFD